MWLHVCMHVCGMPLNDCNTIAGCRLGSNRGAGDPDRRGPRHPPQWGSYRAGTAGMRGTTVGQGGPAGGLPNQASDGHPGRGLAGEKA